MFNLNKMKMKKFVVCFVLLFACSLTIDLQAGCDTVPNVGQMVGKCNVFENPDYTIYTCTTAASTGTICFFNAPPT